MFSDRYLELSFYSFLRSHFQALAAALSSFKLILQTTMPFLSFMENVFILRLISYYFKLAVFFFFFLIAYTSPLVYDHFLSPFMIFNLGALPGVVISLEQQWPIILTKQPLKVNSGCMKTGGMTSQAVDSTCRFPH